MLKDILDEFQQKYHFKLSSKPSSPVMEFSAGLVLQYARQLVCASTAERKPFYLSVPDKEHFIVHFACTLLLHYLFEDCFDATTISLKIGDRAELFGSVAKYQGTGKSEAGKPVIRLLFANDARYEFPVHYATFLNKVNADRKLSKSPGSSKTYHSVNDLNSLLGLSRKETVNLDALSSKLYFVTGRGHAVATREKLRKQSCINQNLADVFRLDVNLVVTPNLEALKSVINSSVVTDDSFFIESLVDDLAEIAEVYDGDSNLINLVKRLHGHIESTEFTPVFRQLFDQLAESIDDPYRARLLNLANQMPTEKIGLPDGLRIVVLANATLAADYANTINGLIMQGIPVVVLTDRSELASMQDRVFEGLSDSYRFYWSRKQVRSLMIEEKAEYCDDLFWQKCVRYANQNITVRSYHDPAGDTLFNVFESNPDFARLNGFENLKKAYYQHLRPVLYLLKNTPGNHQNVSKMVLEQVDFFNQAFKSVESQLPGGLASAVTQGLLELKYYDSNPKHLPDGQPVFIQQIEFLGHPKQRTAQLTQKSLQVNDLHDIDSDALVFTGFPYREWNGKYLHDAVFHSLIRSVIVLAWPTEAQRTISYLMKRIQASTFADNLPQWISNRIMNWQLPYQQGRPDESDLIIHEGELPVSAASISEPTHVEPAFEEVQRYIGNFRFTALSGRTDYIGDYMVPADVLYFHNGSYMLLPHGRGGRVHVVSTQHKMTGEIDQATFQELSIGDTVVCFNMNREIIRHLSREHLSSAYEDLDIWRNCLQSLLNAKSGHFSQLEASLLQQKKVLGLSAGSPTRQNIIRWLYETDMLAPHNSNTWLILRASGLLERDADLALGKIEKAKRLIIRNSSQVSGRIRSRIMTVLRDSQLPEADILLDVDGISVAVQCGRITDIEKRTDMEVPYASTKRFIID